MVILFSYDLFSLLIPCVPKYTNLKTSTGTCNVLMNMYF